MRIAAIIAAGGRGERLGADRPKQLLRIGAHTILERSVEAFVGHPRVSMVVVVVPADRVPELAMTWRESATPVEVVAGGVRRQDSVANGFAALEGRADLVVIHDAARPFVSEALISRTIDAAIESGAALAALPCSDTVKLAREPADAHDRVMVERTIPRERVYLAQTPQVFRADVLRAAITAGRTNATATDEAALAEAAGYVVRVVSGDPSNIKITTSADLEVARAMSERATDRPGTRVGTGYDLHRLVEGRPLILGGVTLPHTHGLAGHSDADVLAHAVTDAVLGAVALGDIGRHFPDTDPQWSGADSMVMLAHAVDLARRAGYRVENVDAVVIAERPKLLPHLPAIRASLARRLDVDLDRVSVKGKTNEGVGELGRGEAIAVHAVALVVAA
jgi:2-C-methyl-D-erythritol 4-phosphate cytidylyltransferase/2-C-methyl-D-erythritol 2,4-cyclodiphosphate synthase